MIAFCKFENDFPFAEEAFAFLINDLLEQCRLEEVRREMGLWESKEFWDYSLGVWE